MTKAPLFFRLSSPNCPFFSSTYFWYLRQINQDSVSKVPKVVFSHVIKEEGGDTHIKFFLFSQSGGYYFFLAQFCCQLNLSAIGHNFTLQATTSIFYRYFGGAGVNLRPPRISGYTPPILDLNWRNLLNNEKKKGGKTPHFDWQLLSNLMLGPLGSKRLLAIMNWFSD